MYYVLLKENFLLNNKLGINPLIMFGISPFMTQVLNNLYEIFI